MKTGKERLVSRRDFVLGTSLTTLGAVVGLSGCAPTTPSNNVPTGDTGTWLPEAWDHEADLIIVGAGAAGNAAAIDASAVGLSVIMLEAQGGLLGSSVLCNGGICMPGTPLQEEQGIEDSPEKMYSDLVSITAPGNIPELIKVHCDNVGGLWDWLTGMGIEFKTESLIGSVGQSVPREHHVSPSLVIETLSANAKENGTEILLDTPAKKLIQDPNTKRVIGVIAEQGSSTIALKAKKAVLLASGGYSRNSEMLEKNYFGLGNSLAYSGMHDLGEGILMAQEIGADTRNTQYFALMPVQHPSGEPSAAAGMMNVGAIMINKEGERFCDESLGYTQTWPYVAAQTDAVCFQIWDQGIFDLYKENDSSLYNMKKLEASGTLIKAETIEDLATQLQVPAESLAASIDKYNNDIATVGYDTVFGRDHLVSENGEPDPIDVGPFYAFEAGLVMYSTTGGLKENEGSQVLDVFGDPIEGLYCAGGICNYAKYGVDIAHHSAKAPSGIGFGGAMVYGRLVAKYVAELDSWE